MKQTSFGARTVLGLSVIALVCPLLPGRSAWAAPTEFTTDFRIEECTFSNTGRNPYFSLNPGDRLTLAGGGVDLQIKVLNETRVIKFVTAQGVPLSVKTRVVEELEKEDGVEVERSRNFFARCTQTNDIFYFGEEILTPGIPGAWEAGKGDPPAQPGLIMPGRFLLGSRYFQEVALEVALDRAEHVAMGLTITVPTVPAQTFEDCVEVLETTPLEPGSKSTKRYCPAVGLVFDNGVELVGFNIAPN